MFQANEVTFLDYNDFILAPAYLFLILIFAYLYRNVALRGTPIRKFFIPGMLVKIIGGIGVELVYGFYYHGGDTFYYFYDSRTFNNALKEGVGLVFKLLLLSANVNTPETYESTFWLVYFRNPSGWMADKVYGIISIFCFHS